MVVTSKIVALSEGRTTTYKNEKERAELIKKESSFALKTKYTWLTIKDGMVMASAGIDESNADGKVIQKLIDGSRRLNTAPTITKPISNVDRLKATASTVSQKHRADVIRVGTERLTALADAKKRASKYFQSL